MHIRTLIKERKFSSSFIKMKKVIAVALVILVLVIKYLLMKLSIKILIEDKSFYMLLI